MSPCVGGKSESMDCVSSVFGDLAAGDCCDDLADAVDAVDAARRGGSCDVLEARYASIRLDSCSLLSKLPRRPRFFSSSSRVISCCTLFRTRYLNTLRTTPANCALSRMGSEKEAPTPLDKSSVDRYVLSTEDLSSGVGD